MKAVQITRTGGPEVLTVVDLPIPQPKASEAVIELKAIGINFIDVYFREGRYPTALPFIDGQEGAGIVRAIGNDVRSLKVGDRVAYTNVLGAYAEYAAVPSEKLVVIPDELDFKEATALMLQGMTAHYLAKSTYPIQKGDTCLIHAGAGGVGQLLVQIAKMLGATVIATAGNEEKVDLVRKFGADKVINYSKQDFELEVKQFTGGKGVNVIYDGVGKSTFSQDLNILQTRGYLVLFGASSGAVPPFDPMILSSKGSLFLTRPTLGDYVAQRDELEYRAAEIFQWVRSGKLRLSIGQTYRLEDVRQAHHDLEARKTTGKSLLIP